MVKIYFATDHAGFEIKEELLAFVRDELGYEVEDSGAYEYNASDDYPDFVHTAARAVSKDPENSRAIIIGGSGQGEAMAANRHEGVRAAVYYGEPQVGPQADADGTLMDILTLSREHNNANVLSLGARFMSDDEMKVATKRWLGQKFSAVDRHERRIRKIDILNTEN